MSMPILMLPSDHMLAAPSEFLDRSIVVCVEAHSVANLAAIRLPGDYPNVALKSSVAAVDFLALRKLDLNLLHLFFSHGGVPLSFW